MVASSVGGAGAGCVCSVKVGAWGVLSSGEGVRAQWGIVSGLAVSIRTDSGAEGKGVGAGARKGVGEGAEERQTGVVGVESVSVSMSVGVSTASLPGGGVVRSRMVTFFLRFLGLEMWRGDGLAALGVRTARLRLRAVSSSFAIWMAVLALFFNC